MNSNDVAELYKSARHQEKFGNFEEAIKAYTTYLEYEPSSYHTLYGLGICFYGLENFRKSNVYFERSLEFAEGRDRSIIRTRIALNLRLMNENDKATSIANEIIEIDDKYPGSYIVLSDIYYHHYKKYQNVIKCLTKSFELGQEKTVYYLNMLGDSYLRVGDYKNAHATFFEVTLEAEERHHLRYAEKKLEIISNALAEQNKQRLISEYGDGKTGSDPSSEYKPFENYFCKWCGGKFNVQESNARKNVHYCSLKCQLEAQGKGVF